MEECRLGIETEHLEACVVRRKVELIAEFDVAAPGVADILAVIDLHRL